MRSVEFSYATSFRGDTNDIGHMIPRVAKMRCLSPIFLSYPRGIYLRIPARRYDGFNNPLFFFPKAICGRSPLYRIANLEVFHIIPRDSYARPTVWGMKSPAGGGRGVGCYAMTFKPGTFSSMNALMFFMASPFHAPPSASTRANFTPSLSLQRNTKELSGCSTSVKVR